MAFQCPISYLLHRLLVEYQSFLFVFFSADCSSQCYITAHFCAVLTFVGQVLTLTPFFPVHSFGNAMRSSQFHPFHSECDSSIIVGHRKSHALISVLSCKNVCDRCGQSKSESVFLGVLKSIFCRNSQLFAKQSFGPLLHLRPVSASLL